MKYNKVKIRFKLWWYNHLLKKMMKLYGKTVKISKKAYIKGLDTFSSMTPGQSKKNLQDKNNLPSQSSEKEEENKTIKPETQDDWDDISNDIIDQDIEVLM